MIELQLTDWESYKALIANKGLALQYVEHQKRYELYAGEASMYMWRYNIGKDGGAEQVDFEANYKSSANTNIAVATEVHIIDQQVVTVDVITASQPQSYQLIPTGQKMLMMDVVVPAGKKWWITAWDGSGMGKGYYEMYDYDNSHATPTVFDALDSLTGWAKGDKVTSFTLDTSVKHSGTASIKLVIPPMGASDKGRMIKSYTATDMSNSDEIGIWVNGSGSGRGVTIKLFQGGNSFMFGVMPIKSGWNSYEFPLEDVAGLDMTIIDKIEVWVTGNGFKLTQSENIWIDELYLISGVVKSYIDRFFNGANLPHQHIFPTAIPVLAGHSVRIKVQNNDASDAYYEVGFNGREVNNV